jgi:hypothetical protein
MPELWKIIHAEASIVWRKDEARGKSDGSRAVKKELKIR